MYNIQDAHSFWAWMYFATLIVVSDCHHRWQMISLYALMEPGLAAALSLKSPLKCTQSAPFRVSGHQSSRMGKYNVLRSRRTFVLELALLRRVNRGKFRCMRARLPWQQYTGTMATPATS